MSQQVSGNRSLAVTHICHGHKTVKSGILALTERSVKKSFLYRLVWCVQMGADQNESDQMVREFMQKNKRLQDERDDLNGQLKGLMPKMNALKEEVEDARAAAEAANADKANVEKDWSTRLIKVRCCCCWCYKQIKMSRICPRQMGKDYQKHKSIP